MVTTLHNNPTSEECLDELINWATRKITEGDGDEITIDCSSITVIRSSMLDRLIRLHLDAKQSEKRLVLVNVSELVSEVLTLTRLDRMLHVRNDESHDLVSEHHFDTMTKERAR